VSPQLPLQRTISNDLLTALLQVRKLVVGQGERPKLFLFASHLKAHPVAIYMSRIPSLDQRHVFIAAHGTTVLRRESARDVKVAVLIERYGPGDLASCAIKLQLGAAIRHLQKRALRPTYLWPRYFDPPRRIPRWRETSRTTRLALGQVEL
jgi:hypothetical protein